MSRVRRGDANLHFPERVIQLHKVDPSADELELIRIVGEGIKNLNRLAQISILQALISSPHALNSQLRRMAENKTVPTALSVDVDRIVQRGNVTAKLRGLGALVEQLRSENPQRWRMVVFTTRRETQTAIEAFLRERSIPCGLINGDSGQRNQATIAKFVKPIPELNVIVSTEAGSEGVNLQAANVLVNYDLPWNPMIIEQRIGRIQRLASTHASVCIFNIILRGTFEEYIVGRLMEKLQMASQAIGDLEALLGASGLSEQEEDAAGAFEEKIRQLVMSSLAGADTAAGVQMAAKSIADAKIELETQAKDIDSMFGDMNGSGKGEVALPDLPEIVRSKDFKTFVIEALASLGTHLKEQSPGVYVVDDDGKRSLIAFDEADAARLGALYYGPGTGAFNRLASRITNSGGHLVVDVDDAPAVKAESLAKSWVESFGGRFVSAQVGSAERSFTGSALLRVRATVAHDSYERLIDATCNGGERWSSSSPSRLAAIGEPLSDLPSLGVDPDALIHDATADRGIAEFCRFYLERRAQEVASAGTDERKVKKIEDEFTPRMEAVSVGLQGAVLRRLSVKVQYEPEAGTPYESELKVVPSKNEIVQAPELCIYSGDKRAPKDALGRCDISNRAALRHALVTSELSGRLALPEYTGVCSLTGKRILQDELRQSDITGKSVMTSLLKSSAISGKIGESEFFDACAFTNATVLKSELLISQISGKKFRSDEQIASALSGTTGHKSEFVFTSDSQDPLLLTESETCEVTGKVVRIGTLEKCAVTGSSVLPQELEKCAATGRRALKRLLVSSSISGARLLEAEAVSSASGKYCLPRETKLCAWSGTKFHPDDLRLCQLTGVPAHFEFMTTTGGTCLEPLVNLLRGISHKSDGSPTWPSISSQANRLTETRLKIESSESSPSGKCLAVCASSRNWIGLNVRHVGMVYSMGENSVIGRLVIGKRTATGWTLERTI
jgi:hypothetical protein